MTVLLILASLFVTIFAEIPAPYPASGWRPQGQQFNLPSRQVQQQYGAPSTQTTSNQYAAPNNQYGAPNNQFSATNNVNSAPNNQYGAPVNQNPPSEFPARNFADGSNFAPNRVNLNPNYESQNRQNNFNNPQNRINNYNPVDENRVRQQQQQQQQQFGRLRQNQREEFPRNEFGASNVDFQNARRPLNNQKPQNDDNDRNSNQDLSDEQNEEQILFRDGQDQDDFPRNINKDPERKYGTPTTTPRSVRGQRPERTTPTPVTTTEETETDLEQPNNVAISTAVAGSDSTGQYYILQPDGRLQRVVFMTSQDKTSDKNAAFIANIMYETVEPLKGPIYSYSADNQLVRIN